MTRQMRELVDKTACGNASDEIGGLKIDQKSVIWYLN